MSDVVFRTSVCDANEFPAVSHNDTRHSISTALLGILRAFALVFFSLCSFITRSVFRLFGRTDACMRVQYGSMGGADLHIAFLASG